MYVQQETLDNGIFVYVLNSCGLVKVVKKKDQISRTQEQTKPVKENLSRKNCSSYRRVSELVKENLLVQVKCGRYIVIVIGFTESRVSRQSTVKGDEVTFQSLSEENHNRKKMTDQSK